MLNELTPLKEEGLFPWRFMLAKSVMREFRHKWDDLKSEQPIRIAKEDKKFDMKKFIMKLYPNIMKNREEQRNKIQLYENRMKILMNRS
jgi:hypothetical protein